MADPKIPYHCSFLLDKSGGILRLAIAWRRVGNSDYGIYLASDPNSSMIEFMATYNEKGELQSFLVSDKQVSAGKPWEEDHLDAAAQPPAASELDAETLRALANAFCDDWLESYGASEAERLLKRIASAERGEKKKGLSSVIKSNLPIQVRLEKMPDILADAHLTENGFLYSFRPHSHGGSPGSLALLEGKMRLFMELI